MAERINVNVNAKTTDRVCAGLIGAAARTVERFGALMKTAACAVLLVIAVIVPGCDDKAGENVAPVTIGGKKFFLELADTPDKRFRGLSERTHIDPDGGMLFVFPNREIAVHGFVMRDCPIAIDIIYLDATGRIVAMHEMTPEPPRDPSRGEGTPADANNVKYNSRLPTYSSRFPSQFVIELAGGTLKTLKLAEGQEVKFDRAALLKRVN